MSKKSDNAYDKFNLMREKSGLPTVGRRDFMKLMAMASAGLSIPFTPSCTENATPPLGLAGQTGIETNPAAGSAGIVVTGSGGKQPTTVGTGGRVVSTKGSGGKGGKGGSTAPSGKGGTPGTGGKAGSGASTGKCATCSKVGITRNANIETAVKNAIQLAGGLSAVKQGDTVVIKPNITGYTTDYDTHPEVLVGIIKAVSDYTEIKNITVAECTALGMDTMQNASESGILDAVTGIGAKFDPWDQGEYVDFTHEKWRSILTPRRVPKSLCPMQYDHFINAPVLKNHTMGNAVYTACIKLFMGILPYAQTGGRADMHTGVAEKVAELHMVVPKKLMNIVDATKPGLVNGPTPSVYGEGAGLILASTDIAACDSVALAVLRCYAKMQNIAATYRNVSVFKQAQIVRAVELELGVADPQKIEILDRDVDNIADIKAEWV